jgi:hypothetical protein
MELTREHAMRHRPKSFQSDKEEEDRQHVKRSFYEIRKEIQPRALRRSAILGEIEIDQELRERLAQIRRKSSIAWPRFPAQLIAHGRAFVEYGRALMREGTRMAKLRAMPKDGAQLSRKFNSVKEWQESHKQ